MPYGVAASDAVVLDSPLCFFFRLPHFGANDGILLDWVGKQMVLTGVRARSNDDSFPQVWIHCVEFMTGVLKRATSRLVVREDIFRGDREGHDLSSLILN
jgi:hypothetical protein